MQNPEVIEKLRKGYIAQTDESKEKMKESIRVKYGVQLHKDIFGTRSRNCNSVATTGAAVFHCHVGCSALVAFRRMGWRRNVVYAKRSATRSVRRKMTPEELEVHAMPYTARSISDRLQPADCHDVANHCNSNASCHVCHMCLNDGVRATRFCF